LECVDKFEEYFPISDLKVLSASLELLCVTSGWADKYHEAKWLTFETFSCELPKNMPNA
jgi:hypothetical protein